MYSAVQEYEFKKMKNKCVIRKLVYFFNRMYGLTNRCAWNGVNKHCCHLLKKKDFHSFVLLPDDLKEQMQEGFRTTVLLLLWYRLPDATDLWQPNEGYVSCLKS